VEAVLTALESVEGAPWVVIREAPLPPEDDTIGVIKWLHEPSYIGRVRAACADAPTIVDTPDCPVSQGSFDAAAAAAGLAVQAALDLVNERLQRAFIAARPPGHHALHDRAMGFCFFNNVALAAETIVRAWDQPVLIVDFDVHHGNGTQAMFYERGDVGYLSVHRYPFYPGTGRGEEVGTGSGRGATFNVPLAAGADDEIYATALEGGLEQLGSVLKPAAVLVSAGFDAHIRDPLGGMNITAEGYHRMTAAIVEAAETWAGGRILSFLEGGYDLHALAESSCTHVATLSREIRGEISHV
jgi:acetoin utilization deacetylase AcuC-like enzyme